MDTNGKVHLCRTCTERQFDKVRGVICGLDDAPRFSADQCLKYKEDAAALASLRMRQEKQKEKKSWFAELEDSLSEFNVYLALAAFLLPFVFYRIYLFYDVSAAGGMFIYYMLLSCLFFATALFVRNKGELKCRVLGDWKFKLLFSLLFISANILYPKIVYWQRFHWIDIPDMLWGLSLVSVLIVFGGVLIVKPVRLFVSKIKAS